MVPTILFTILSDATRAHLHLRADGIPIGRDADQVEFQPAVGVAGVAKQLAIATETLRPHVEPVGHEQVEKPIFVIVGRNHALAGAGRRGYGRADPALRAAQRYAAKGAVA